MTVEYLFTTMILGMAIVHLVCRAAEKLAARFAGKRGHLEGLRNRTTRRDDWYVFFSPFGAYRRHRRQEAATPG